MTGFGSDGEILRASVEAPGEFSGLYERHLDAVARYVARRLGNELAEDVVAEVFVRAFRGRQAFREEHASALPWLLGIANHLIADQRRGERRRLAALQRLAGAVAPAAEVRTEPLAPELVRALRDLSDLDRDTLLLVVWGELSYAEAATALAVPVGTVRSRIARARERLAQAIRPAEHGPDSLVNGETHA